jgi:hypothetical protein
MRKPRPVSGPRRSNIVNIRLDRLDQLFDAFDPHALWHRHLSNRMEEFMMEEVRNLPRNRPVHIRLYVAEDELDATRGADIEHAIRAHFSRQARVFTGRLHALFKRGARSLATGLLVLAFCLQLGPWIGSFFAAEGVGNFVTEGFSILGWAANWRPVEIFLYDWWPLAQQRNLHRRLADAEVELQRLEELPGTDRRA